MERNGLGSRSPAPWGLTAPRPGERTSEPLGLPPSSLSLPPLVPAAIPPPRPASPVVRDPELDVGSPRVDCQPGPSGLGPGEKRSHPLHADWWLVFRGVWGAEPRTEFHGSGPQEAARGTCANTGTLPGPECPDHSLPQPSLWTPRLLFLQWGGEGECDDLTRNTYPTVGSPIYNKQPISMTAAGFQRLY